MSTKNLARTVIEGGRHGWSKFDRRHSNAEERRKGRMTSQVALSLRDVDSVTYAPRKVVSRDFDDKLSPARRWLRSNAGRPWDKVRSELVGRFDTRTTAGRHVLYCHLLQEVEAEDRPWARRRFSVDRHGILRAHEGSRNRFWRPRRTLPEREPVLVAWLSGRRVAERGNRLYWFLPVTSGRFRQGNPLDDVDSARFRRLPDWFRERHHPSAPPLEEN